MKNQDLMFVRANIKDLQKGDWIIVPVQSTFRYLIVQKNPQEKEKKQSWSQWKSVRCSARQDFKDVLGKKYDYNIGKWVDSTRQQKTWIQTFDDHNVRLNVDLEHKNILLIRREEL